MPRDRNRFPDLLAAGARKVLRFFFVFMFGFAVAHMESVQRVERSAANGELSETLLSDSHDYYDRQIMVWSAVPNALAGGAVLIGPEFSREPALLLVNGLGEVLHRWTIENASFNPELPQWWKSVSPGDEVGIDDAHLLPGGDVVFVQTRMSINNYRGERLARMDRDSKILWQVPGDFHHFINIAGSPQKIYTLNSRLREGFPEVAPERNAVRFLEDYVDVYSMGGKKLDSWSLVDAFEHSPYRTWLSSFEINIPLVQRIIQPDGRALYDLFHVNSVQYLDAAKAKALPRAKEGDLLVSFRTLNAIAVFRPETKQIVWAAKGPWRHQHTVQVGDDGKIYMYDNEGRQVVNLYARFGFPEQYLSRIISFDAFTNQIDEIYTSDYFYSYFKGNYQRMANGLLIVSSPLHGKVSVISPEHEVIWELRTVPVRSNNEIPHRKQISFMHYYPAAMVASFSAPKNATTPQ